MRSQEILILLKTGIFYLIALHIVHDPVCHLPRLFIYAAVIQKRNILYRLKNRMLDKGTEENIVRQLLLPEKKENKNYILQWFFMLIALGVGLLLVGFTRPFGLHSIAILAFSMAAGFRVMTTILRNRRTEMVGGWPFFKMKIIDETYFFYNCVFLLSIRFYFSWSGRTGKEGV